MFERFTERARRVVVLAQDAARLLNHPYIGTEHLLVGLIREEEGLAGRVLESLDVTWEKVHDEIVKTVGLGPEPVIGQIPFTPRAKNVLESALRESLAIGHNYIGTEHLLLGLLRQDESVAIRILRGLGVEAESIRTELIQELTSHSSQGHPIPPRGPAANPLVTAISAAARALDSAKALAMERHEFEVAAELRELRRKLEDMLADPKQLRSDEATPAADSGEQ